MMQRLGVAAAATAAALFGAVMLRRRWPTARRRAAAQAVQRDPTSRANLAQVRTTAMHLDLAVDTRTGVVSGFVDLTLDVVDPGVVEVVLDTRALRVGRVVLLNTNQQLAHALDAETPAHGAALRIALPLLMERVDAQLRIRIEYETSPDASALAWLTPAQTAGKKHPFLFSQCQAIHARSLVPCQDTPAVKFVYTASIVCPQPLTALMSAKTLGQSQIGTHTRYAFNQPVPVPSYLLSIAVGELESRQIGPRSHAWSEPSVVDAAAFEFARTEEYLVAAEALLACPYVWDFYDLLVLPPSFPYGGMENPQHTFVTPTLLTGLEDRPLAGTVIHEAVHSWCGNLVTSATWEHFWLNEGFTMFVERKIVGRLQGSAERHLSAIQGWNALQDEVSLRGEDHPFTRLVPDLEGVDPDDAFGTVPYEKGHTLLFHIESFVGEDAMDEFLKAYINTFKFQSITTDTWKAFLLNHFRRHNLEASIDFDAWLYSPGMPPVKPQFDTSRFDAVQQLAAAWADPARPSNSFAPSDIAAWSTRQLILFLDALREHKAALDRARIQALDDTYSLSASKISEIRFRWARLGISFEYQPAIDLAVSFVSQQGRMKFVRPLYRELHALPKTKKVAKATFEKNRPSYHAIAAKMLAKDLGL